MRLNSIRTKLLVVLFLALGSLLLLSVLSLISERETLMADRKVKTQHLVQAATSVVAHFHEKSKSGELPESEAKAAALSTLKAMRYATSDYFWVNDMHPYVVMHPMKPELDGKDVSELKDPNGLALFSEFVKVVKKDGSGFVEYFWPKPGASAPVPKVSYVEGFAPWGWVIGSGIYVDDVNALFMERATIMGAISGALVLALAGLLIVLMRSIAKPVQQLRDSMHEIQSTRNLALRVSEDGNHETKEIAIAFNEMVGSFQGLIRQVISSTEDVLMVTHRLSESSAAVAADSARQCEFSASMAGAMEEMQGSIESVSISSVDAHHIAEDAGRHATEGRNVVISAAKEMTQIAAVVTDASSQIKALGDSAGQITSIVNVIKEIADQTNLLALNAAIEAARAGEAGRGFAVVADEVRKLAERTSKSTMEIGDMISAVQLGTQAAAHSMSEGSAYVNHGVTLAEEAGSSMTEIQAGSETSIQAISQISQAIAEQSIAAQHIVDSVTRIVSMAEKNSDETGIIANSAASLEELAVALQANVKRFVV